MGGIGSKKKAIRPELSDDQKRNILQMFNTESNKDVPSITRDMLKDLWKDILSERVLELTLRYLFKKTDEIQLKDLELFCYKMVLGTTKDKSQTLIDILSVENIFPRGCFETYLSDFLGSYVTILQKQNQDLFSNYMSDDIIKKRDLNIVTEFFMQGINFLDDKVDVEELARWLNSCVFMRCILDSVMKFLFNMEIEAVTPILPKTDKYSSILSLPLVLALSFLVSSYMKKQWRLLFSSTTDPHSWHILYEKIAKQGPTLVLIEDPAGQVFGGFASRSWKQCPTFYGDDCCFLFRLRPELQVFPATGYNSNFQYINHGAVTLPNGLGMGGQLNYFTFFLNSDFGPVIVSKSSSTFRDYVPLASTNEFNFSKFEVWGIGTPDIDEENVRQQTGLIMDRDPSAAAILEIVGKTGYSKSVPQPIEYRDSSSSE